jgi:hypothetical protein
VIMIIAYSLRCISVFQLEFLRLGAIP